MGAAGVRARGVRVVYRGGVRALDGVSLEASEGVVTGVIGPNGAGKTTLLKAIAGLVGYSGSIYIDGREVSEHPRRALARILSYSSEIGAPDLMPLTVREAVLVSMYPVSRGFFESRRDLDRADRVLEELGLRELASRRLYELSSGELRRVVLAMAIAREPRYLLLDEPDAHLDLAAKAGISRLIRRLSRGRVVVFTSHDIVFALNTADRIVMMKRGRIIWAGPAAEAGDPSILREVYGIDFTAIKTGNKIIVAPLYPRE